MEGNVSMTTASAIESVSPSLADVQGVVTGLTDELTQFGLADSKPFDSSTSTTNSFTKDFSAAPAKIPDGPTQASDSASLGKGLGTTEFISSSENTLKSLSIIVKTAETGTNSPLSPREVLPLMDCREQKCVDGGELSPSEASKSGKHKKDVENPFKIRGRDDVKFEPLPDKLRNQATEVNISCHDLLKVDIFSRMMLLAVIFMPGKVKDEWDEWERTEIIPDCHSPKFVKSVRLPAATELDRATMYQLRVYNQTHKAEVLLPSDIVGSCTFKLSEMLQDSSHTIHKSILSPRSGRKKGGVVLTLDFIRHMDPESMVIFDFGFTESAPLTNRLRFVITKALREGRFTPVYRSEVQTTQQLSKFDDAFISPQDFHGGDERRLFRLELYQCRRNNRMLLLGYVQTSLEKLKSMEPGTQLYWWPALHGLSFAHVRVISRKVEEKRCWFVLRLTE
jgi:hypothetical protein